MLQLKSLLPTYLSFVSSTADVVLELRNLIGIVVILEPGYDWKLDRRVQYGGRTACVSKNYHKLVLGADLAVVACITHLKVELVVRCQVEQELSFFEVIDCVPDFKLLLLAKLLSELENFCIRRA